MSYESYEEDDVIRESRVVLPKDREVENLQRELREQKDIVRQLYATIVRALVVLKQLFRVGAVVATYIWLGDKQAYFLAGFIAVVAVLQLTIDKTRQTVNPKIKLSEWNIL